MTRFFGIFVLMLTLVGASLGSLSMTKPKSAVGTWSGKLNMKLSAEAAAKMTPQMKAQQASALAKLRFILKVMKGGTYSIIVSGPASSTSTGKWTQSGSKVTLTSDKATGASKSQVATMSANGKTMSIVLPKNPSATGSITFTRQ